MNRLRWKTGVGYYSAEGHKGTYIVGKNGSFWTVTIKCGASSCSELTILSSCHPTHRSAQVRAEQIDFESFS